MSNSLLRPVVRKHKSKKIYTRNTYRKAFRYLLPDFEHRCAYSLVHVETIAQREMHVDHFDPRKKRKCTYENLFPAYGLCNGSKGDHWPSRDEEALGCRYLNPCADKDYGEVIFENPVTHELVGTTTAARYHIIKLDLNNPALITHRKERSLLAAVLFSTRANLAASQSVAASATADDLIRGLEGMLDRRIPPIPPTP